MVTTDEHDEAAPSNLTARGAYRLNIGVGRDSFLAIARRAGPGPDYAVLDQLMPHPTYAKQRWVAIITRRARPSTTMSRRYSKRPTESLLEPSGRSPAG